MSLKNVIKRLFKLLHILGISPATFCERQRKLIVTRKSEKYMLRFTIVMVVIMEFFFILICVLSFSDAFKVYDSSKTGNKLIFIQLLESVGIQLFLTIMFYVFRHKNVKIFEQIFKFAERINSEECNKRIIRRFYIQYQLNIILIILFIGNITILGTTTDRFSIIMYICNVVVLAIYFIYISIYLTCFTCLIFVAVESMRFLNNCIRMTQSTKELMKLLNLRQKLLFMCQDLELVYGLVILLQAGFTVTSISAFFFLTTVAFEWLNQKISTILYVILQTSLYAMPPLIIFVKAIWANDIDKEVFHLKFILNSKTLTFNLISLYF